MLAATIDTSLVRVSVKDASVYDTTGPYPHESEAAGGFSTLDGFGTGNPLSELPPGSMFVVYAEVDYEDVTFLPWGRYLEYWRWLRTQRSVRFFAV